MTDIEKQINLVVVARGVERETNCQRVAAYNVWVEANQHILDLESDAKSACQEAEAQLRAMALSIFAETQDKKVAPGIGIRVKTVLDYDGKDAMDWALDHKLALKLDGTAFERIAKTSALSFVAITEEPTATIATELQVIE